MADRVVCAFCGGRSIRALNEYGPRCLVGDYRITTGHVENVWCTSCGLAWNRRMMTDEELAAFYAGYTKKVGVDDEDDLLFGPSESEVETLTASQVTFLVNHVPDARSGRVLDIGCGKGAFLSGFHAARPGWSCVGVEPSREEAALARRNPAFEIHEGMFGDVAFGANAFDLVAIMHVLEHVSEPIAVIDRIRDVLKPGGLAFIEVPNVLDLNMFYDLLLFEHLYHFAPSTLAWQLQQRGFDTLAVDTSSSYGALRIVARKRAGAGTRSEPPALLMADGFAEWTDQWTRMQAICRVGAERAHAGQRVAIFGAGMTSATWLVYSPLFDAPIVGCVDESPWKIGRPFFGRPVHPLHDLQLLNLQTMLVATMPGSQANVAAKLARRAPSTLDVLTFVRTV